MEDQNKKSDQLIQNKGGGIINLNQTDKPKGFVKRKLTEEDAQKISNAIFMEVNMLGA